MTSGLLLGVAALPSKAVVTGFNLSQFADYGQSSNAQPVSGSYSFFANIGYTDLADLSSANVFYNNVQSSFPLGTPLPSGSEFFVGKLFNYSTQAELSAAFPDGTDYIYTIGGGTLGIQAEVFQPDPPLRRFVDDVPFLTGTTYEQLQGLDPSQPFTINFNGTSFDPIPGVFNSKSFRISPTLGGTPVFNVSLNPTDISTVLPANTLAANTSYNFSLGYVRSTLTSNAGFDGASSFGGSFTTTTGSFTTGSILGTTPSNPLLPTPNPGNPNGFTFTNVTVTPGERLFFDPDVAVGYDYAVTGGPLFSSVLIPNALAQGDSNFTLELPGFGNYSLIAGTPFDLLGINPSGFSNFRISGIDTNELLDPTNPTAFVTGLEFTTAGTVTVTQNPIVQNIPVGVPEPSSLLGFGLLGLGLFGRKTRF